MAREADYINGRLLVGGGRPLRELSVADALDATVALVLEGANAEQREDFRALLAEAGVAVGARAAGAPDRTIDREELTAFLAVYGDKVELR